jgi:hypothetical protein
MKFFLLASIIFLPVVASHSWVVKVGLEGGKSRGGTNGGDLTLQRYFCPLPLLADCQPDPKHDIVLTDDALRPCRANVESSPRAKVHAGGDSLYMSWMGNGHVNNGQSDGTCVKFMLAPYDSDPDFDSFTTIPGSECRDYWYRNSEGFLKTDANVTIPANIAPGKYTVLWYWNFTEFWFSSCSDIDILPPVGPTTSPMPVSSTIAPVVKTPSPSKAPIVATSRPSLDDGDIQNYLLNGCTALPYPTLFCQSYLGPGSYCKYYNTDGCGRAYCQGGDFLLNCPQTNPPTTISVSTPSPPPSPAPTPAPTINDDSDTDIYKANGCGDDDLPENFCYITYGTYCKDYQSDGCGRSVCHGQAHSNLNPCD